MSLSLRFRSRAAHRLCLLATLSLAASACDDDEGTVSPDGGVDAGGLPAHGLAVLASNFQSSISLTLLDPLSLAVVRDRCVDSGTRAPALTQAFSADTALAAQPQAGSQILVVDRANATLTWVDATQCQIARQINVSTGFAANPHDAVVLGERIYVSRYEANPAPTPNPADFDEGGDVLVLDKQSGLPVARVDLTAYRTAAAGGGQVLPRPDRLVVSGGRILVSLNNLGPNFAGEEIGAGRVVVIDPASNTVVETLDPPGLENCGGLGHSPGGEGVVVSCNGNFGGTQVNSAGLAWFPRAPGATPAKILPGLSFTRPVSIADAVLLDASRGYVIIPGEFAGTPPDAVFTFDLTTGTVAKVFDGSGGYVLGSLFYDAGSKRLFVAHGDMVAPRIEVFDVTTPTAPRALGMVNPSPMTNLPPQQLVSY